MRAAAGNREGHTHMSTKRVTQASHSEVRVLQDPFFHSSVSHTCCLEKILNFLHHFRRPGQNSEGYNCDICIHVNTTCGSWERCRDTTLHVF